MKIIGIDGKTYGWQLIHANNTEREISSYHNIARNLIKSIFRSDKIWEEVSLPGTNPTLYADFFIPLRKLMLEIHGEQHYRWIPHFHPTKYDWINAKKNDETKKRWCEINNIVMIELPHWESINEWRNRIINFGSTE